MKNLRFSPLVLGMALALFSAGASFVPSAKADSATWSNASSPVSKALYTVWGTSASNIYAGGNGALLKYDGSSWSVVQNRCFSYRAISGSSASDIAAVGMGGPLETFNGTSWTTVNNALAGSQYALVPLGSANYAAAGESWGPTPGNASTPITRMQNGSWVLNPSSTTTLEDGWVYRTVMNAAWGSSSSNIWAAGWNEAHTGPAFYHWDGTLWHADFKLANGTPPIMGMWGVSASNIWAVGGDKNGGGRRDIYHYDGTAWTKSVGYTLGADGAKGQVPTAIWGTAANDIWIIGENAQGNSFLHYDGSTWSIVGGPARNAAVTYRSIWGTSSTDIWAVGDGGSIIHFGTSSVQGSGPLTDTYDCTGQKGNPAPTLDVAASTRQVSRPGGTVQINWRTANADQLTIDGVPVDPPTGGFFSYWISQNHTFSIKACASATGACVTKTIDITALPGVSVSLDASPDVAVLPVATTTLTTRTAITDPGSLTYTFYCNRSDSGTNVTAPYDAQFTNETDLNKSMSSCAYGTAGSYTAKVIVQQGSIAAEARTAVSRVNPSLNVNVSTSTTNIGALPFTPTLSISVGSNLSGPITYTYYCNRGDSGVNITTPFSGQTTDTATTQTFTGCTYTTSGSYSFKVIVQQAGQSAQTQVGLTPNGLTARMDPSPNSQVPPINNVKLKALITGGSATGLIDYYFWCVSAAGQSPTSGDDDYHLLGTSNVGVTSLVTCNYPASNVAKVIIVRGGATITVLASIVTLPTDLSLVVSRGNGTLALNQPVTMFAHYDGQAAGDTTLYFYCTSTDTRANVVPGYDYSVVMTDPKGTVTHDCSYATAGTYSPKIVITRGTAPNRAGSATVVASGPTVTVTAFYATPSSGLAPVDSILSVGAVGGTATGNYDFFFYCDRADATTDLSIPADYTVLDQATAPGGRTPVSTPAGTCIHNQSGTYQPRVIVRQGGVNGALVNAGLVVTYGSSIPQPPSVTFLVNGSANPIVQLGQTLNFTWTTTGVDQILASSSNWSLPASPPLNCAMGCGALGVADQTGNQIYYIQVSGPGGVLKGQVTVQVAAKSTDSSQTNYNYSRGN